MATESSTETLSTRQRLELLPKKLRSRGISWLTKRFIAEIRTPTTYPGKLFRHFARVIYAAAFTVIGLPARLFTNDGTLHLFYDLAVSPITFDFAWALTLAEHERIKRRLRRIHVVIVPGWDEGLRDEGPEYEDKVDREAYCPWRNCFPAPRPLQFAPAVDRLWRSVWQPAKPIRLAIGQSNR